MGTYRIVETFKITGRGIIYMLQISKNEVIHMGDLMYDLQGHRFKVKGIEMVRRAASWACDNIPSVGIMFELLDKAEVSGRILLSEPTEVNFLFCNHPIYSKRVDEDYEAEYQAAGLNHPCVLFSYEDLRDGKLSLYGEQITGLTIYRGWMMKPEMYKTFYDLLEKQGILLINTPEEYEHYHLLPNWYEEFKDYTAESRWTTTNCMDDAIDLSKRLRGSYIVKDYVKSRKHEWYDACYIQDIADRKNTEKVIRNFVHRQDDYLVGGVVLRQFVPLKQIGFHEQSGIPIAEEYRVFVHAGRILVIDDYWTNAHEVYLTDSEYKWIEEIAGNVKSNFVTIDLARKADGSLIIMELGDGQVSGLQQIEAAGFYRTFEGQNINNPK